MPTAKTVKIENGLTGVTRPVEQKRILDAKWLVKNWFEIVGRGGWADDELFPDEVELRMLVTEPLSIYVGEDVYIKLADAKFGVLEGNYEEPVELDWLTEKQIEKKIKQEMRATCTPADFSDDFLPAALTIVIRAQAEAKKIIAQELKEREEKKPVKVITKATKKPKKKRKK